jgi:hypothetical protein
LSAIVLHISDYITPVSHIDHNGNSWKSIWKSIKKFAEETIGLVASIGKEIGYESYNFFWSTELGTGYSKSFESEKPINLYFSAPAQFWKIWEYSVGIDINFDGYGGGVYLGTESGFSVHAPKTSFDISTNIRGQISFKTSWTSNGESYEYAKFSINTLEIIATGLVVVGLVYSAPILISTAVTIGFIMMTY